jgi:endonuclease/exonuclease/phosphatase (EEP) superfamily protein YafD
MCRGKAIAPTRPLDPAADDENPPRARPRAPFQKLIAAACWAYVVMLLGLWLVLYFAGDRWWVATLILFGPRWIYAAPLALLLPAVLRYRVRYLWVLLVAIGILLGPIMDLCIPWRSAFAEQRTGPQLRVLTCNGHFNAMDPQAMASLIRSVQPDLVAIQECSPRSLVTLFGAGGWNCMCDGELCLGSRFPIRIVRDAGRPRIGYGAATHFEVQTPTGAVQFFDVHLESPHFAFRAALHREPDGAARVEQSSATRLREAGDLARSVDASSGPVLLAGDFNLPADSTAYRQTLAKFSDAFSVGGFGFGWTYRPRFTMTRIDHILSGDGWVCRRCWVGPDVGSPHRPLIADLQWVGTAK